MLPVKRQLPTHQKRAQPPMSLLKLRIGSTSSQHLAHYICRHLPPQAVCRSVLVLLAGGQAAVAAYHLSEVLPCCPTKCRLSTGLPRHMVVPLSRSSSAIVS